MAAPPALAQISLHGTVTDAQTGEPLPSANIQIADTYRGTITNAEGRYTLTINRLPATVVVRFIGFETARRRITAASDAEQHFRLQPSTLQMDELVVTGENPADRIMRRVIERKQQWRAQLDTWEADAYNRFTVRNDSGIVLITETQTTAFWDRTRGMEEVVQARRQTANLLEENLPDAAALAVSNLYDDNIEMAGHTLIGVTHPDALRHYTFTLDSTRAIDGQRVYDIRVAPASRLKTAFEGRVAVLDSAYALLEVDLQPSKAFLFPPPIKNYRLHFEQQYSNFGGPFWLPVDFRATHQFDIAFSALLSFPTIRVDQVSRLTNYKTNVSLPDSLYEDERRIRVDSVAVRRMEAASLTQQAPGDTLRLTETAVPLSRAEEAAYRQIDSTDTLVNALQPRGPLARFIDMEGEEDGDEQGVVVSASSSAGDADLGFALRPRVWFNRVEGAHVGGEGTVGVGDRLNLSAELGYSTAALLPVQWTYGGAASLGLGAGAEVFGTYRYGVDPRYRSAFYGRIPVSLWTLAGAPDYFDYYGNERWRIGIQQQVDPLDAEVRLRYNDERHFSVPATTAYDLLGRTTVQPLNPPLPDEGRLRSLRVEIEIGDHDRTFGITGRNHLLLRAEHSNEAWLASDYAFTRFHAEATVHLNTFFRRRLLPNTLDLRAVGGTFTGSLPLQRFGIVDASLEPLSVFGTLRTRSARPYQGEQYLGVFWEHSFRTVPLEWMGLDRLAQRGYNLIVHGGHVRTWIHEPYSDEDLVLLRPFPDDSNGFHHELGLSFSGLFDAVRIDLTKRLDAPGWTLRLGVARIF